MENYLEHIQDFRIFALSINLKCIAYDIEQQRHIDKKR